MGLINAKRNISSDIINSLFKKDNTEIEVIVFDEIDSTNNEAKRKISENCSLPLLILSNSQYAGRGRMDRSFYSPKDTGLYLSIILPQKPYENYNLLTIISAVSVTDAIMEETGINASIKWVNDIYYDSKKISGILTEAIPSNDGIIPIIGIGININTNSFPQEIKDIAGALGKNISRESLAVKICKNIFLNLSLNEKEPKKIIEHYKERCFTLGMEIDCYENGEIIFSGKAISINNDGSLNVQIHNDEIKTINSGEISIRNINI